MSNNKKYEQIFEYLSAPEAADEPEGILVFGRKDILVAKKIVDLSHSYFAKFAVISGGIGKDSGDLTVPESTYLAEQAAQIAKESGIQLPKLYLETESKNGGENVRKSLDVMRSDGLPYSDGLTAVAHATSLRRLAASIEHEAVVQNDPIAAVHRVASDYDFDSASPTDQKEARNELLRLAEWPAKDWLQIQADLPMELVEFAAHERTQ